jgi:MFS family permease
MTGATIEARSVRYGWYVAGLLTLAQVISYLDRFLPSLLVQPIKHDLGLNDFQIGLLLGPAFTLFYIILGIPVGWLADRVSRRALLAVGIAIWCTMTAAAAGARGFVSLLVTRLGVGVGEATVAPTSISLLSDYFSPERRSRAISLFMSGTFLGAGTAFLFFGPLVHHIESLPLVSLPIVGPLQSWRLCFLIVGAPGLLLTVLLLTIREPSRRDWNGTGVGVLGRRPTFGEGVAFILKHWRAFGTLFVGSACNVTMGALALWNVGLFKRTWNWNVAQVGVAVGLILFTAGPLGTLLGVFLTNRDTKAGRPDGTLRALFVGLVIGVPAYVLFPLMPSAGLGLAWLFCAHVGQAMATAAGPATLVVLAPGAIRAQTTAIYYLVISALAQLIGPPLVGLIADGIGSPDALRYAVSIEAGGVGIVAIWLVLLGFRHYRRSVAELREVSAELPPQAAPAIQAVSERA